MARDAARPARTRITRCCPRRWRSGRSSCSAGCCRGTSRSSWRSTGASSTRSGRPASDDSRVAALSIIDESGGRFVRMAEPRHGGQPPRERRVAAAFRAAGANRDARLRRAVAREVLQRDQRRHAAPVPGARATLRSRALLDQPHRRRLAARSRAAPRTRAAGGRPGVPAGMARGEAAGQACTGRGDPAAHRRHRRPGEPVRRAGQAAARVQAPAPERAAHPDAVPAAARGTRRRTCRRARSCSAARPRQATRWPS